jgi:UDP-N-acetylmuramoylalanine--D-glutamate ligase
VLNADDPVVASYAAGARAAVIFYRRGAPERSEIGLEDGWIVARAPLDAELRRTGLSLVGPIMPVSELAIPGQHNVSNAMAAIAVAGWYGIPSDVIRSAAAAFTGVEHRLEQVAIIDGVRFVNDSQGTQPDAVIAALRAFERPLVLIAGGRDKGVDLSSLGHVAAERADAAVLMGESGQTLAQMFRSDGMARVEEAGSLEAAVDRADEIARDLLAGSGSGGPATVVLSPAAASFDMFVDYAARGRAFKAAVAALAERRRAAEPTR